MGEHEVSEISGSEELRQFMRALLADVRALQRLIEEGKIEQGIRRIGAEQELFLCDESWEPTPRATEVLAALNDPQFTPELALFNLEANLLPKVLNGDCLSQMEGELNNAVQLARVAAEKCGAQILLTGILPTLHLKNLGLDAMTPRSRYQALNKVMSDVVGGEFRTLIKGLDELRVNHDNVMLEACNTSFQIHFQVGAHEFARLYNLAQAVTGPVLAAAVNSPVLLQHRLWHETRVALFQQSLDARSRAEQERGQRQRVTFGDRWVRDSVLEIYREDISRFRVLIAGEYGDDPIEAIERGEVPSLKALSLHNGTVYRWNRPCYGTKDGIAHLRIENRVLPAGPTVQDEVANAAFFFGLMTALDRQYPDITKEMEFDHAKENFMAAARYGLKAQLTWTGGKQYTAQDLLIQQLLPAARDGLIEHGIDGSDVDRFCGILEDRVKSGRTGAQWAFDSLAAMNGKGTLDERHRALVSSTAAMQATDKPGHEWELASFDGTGDWRHSFRTVGQVMTTDLFTVGPEDLVDLAASLMEWEHLRHVPVEDAEGRLVGLLSHRALMRVVAHGPDKKKSDAVAVREIMKRNPVTVHPDTPTLETIDMMRTHKVGCLPVMKDDRLVGIVTEHDFIEIAYNLLAVELREN